MMRGPTRNFGHFRAQLFQTDAGLRRTLATQRTLRETDAERRRYGKWPGHDWGPAAAHKILDICPARADPPGAGPGHYALEYPLRLPSSSDPKGSGALLGDPTLEAPKPMGNLASKWVDEPPIWGILVPFSPLTEERRTIMVEWITTTGKEWYSDMSEYLEDNLSDYPIPSPTNEGIVCKLVEGKKNEKVILYRGTSYEQANNMEQFCSAGGKQLPNTNAQPPSSEAAKRQVGFGRALPEFTAKYQFCTLELR